MLTLKKMIRSDLFWSLTGGFAVGAFAMVSLQQPHMVYNSFAQQGPSVIMDRS